MKELSKSTKILIFMTLIIVAISAIVIISSAFSGSPSSTESEVVAPPTTDFSGFN